MSDVTDADREKAADVAMRLFPEGHERDHAVYAIAAALAEEREKARAPFLAVVAQYEAGELWASSAIALLRRAAEETE